MQLSDVIEDTDAVNEASGEVRPDRCLENPSKLPEWVREDLEKQLKEWGGIQGFLRLRALVEK